jgi:hypothetical protein
MFWQAVVARILVPAGLALLLMSRGPLLNIGQNPSLTFADAKLMESDAKMIALYTEAKSAMNALRAAHSHRKVSN